MEQKNIIGKDIKKTVSKLKPGMASVDGIRVES